MSTKNMIRNMLQDKSNSALTSALDNANEYLKKQDTGKKAK